MRVPFSLRISANPDAVGVPQRADATALLSEITLKGGAVQQSNYHDYKMIGIDQMPQVEVYIVKSAEPPTGVGEPATPVIAPAVANALTSITGKSFDRLPLQLTA